MISKNQKHSLLRSLLSNSLPVLCKNGLGIPDVQFSVEALVGITVGDEDEVILVSIKETITSDGSNISHVWRNEKADKRLTSSPSVEIKKENGRDSTAYRPEVYDLTEEPDDVDCSTENLQQSTARNKDESIYRRSDPLDNPADNDFMTRNARLNDRVGSSDNFFGINVKDEYQGYDGSLVNSNEVYGNMGQEFAEDALSNVKTIDEEEDCSFSLSYSVSETRRQHHNRRGSFGLRSARSGRPRFFHRGRLKRFGSAGNPRNHFAIAATEANFVSSASHSDNVCLRNSTIVKQDGTYQDIMKEVCQQVVNQSMSMETQYVCHICQARRCSKSSLMDHIRGTHLAMDKYTCMACGERFRWFMQLHRHRKKFHSDGGDEQAADYGPDDDDGSNFQSFDENH